MAENQFVIFNLNGEEYGIDIMNVKEIGPYKKSIKVPNSPSFIEGIVNYRGEVIPIVNLKKKFNLECAKVDNNTRIIVINLEDKQVGFIVDEASQTLKLSDEEIELAPEIVTGMERKYLTGVGKKDDRLVMLLDLKKVLSKEEKEQIRNMDMEDNIEN